MGVQIEIQQVEWATYLQDLHRERLQVWGGSGWQADYPDPQDFIDILFHSESKGNHGKYSNSQVDEILEEARIDQDPLTRISKYNKADISKILHIINDASLKYKGVIPEDCWNEPYMSEQELIS